MLDVTAFLKELSESFQRADLFITDVARKLDSHSKLGAVKE